MVKYYSKIIVVFVILGGNNIIIPEKNLKHETLEANGMNSKVQLIIKL